MQGTPIIPDLLSKKGVPTMMYNPNMRESYTTSIGIHDIAHSFLKRQSNKAATMRMLLSDVAQLCPDLGDYAEMDEARRLSVVFNRPDTKQIRKAMLSSVDSTMDDETAMHRMVAVVQYAHLWRKYADSLVPVKYQRYANAVIVLCADTAFTNDNREACEIEFAVKLKDFLTACEKGEMSTYACHVNRLDREFIKMVFVLFDAWELISDESKRLNRFTPNYARVARTTLEGLREYYADRYGKSVNSLELDYLHQLCREHTSRPL